jgi:predicted nucleotidyltransferase
MGLLGDALLTKTQQKVLGLLYSQPEKSFYTKEILRLTGMGVATIKRELDRMKAAGILSQALSPLADKIDWAFVFGSVASGKETSGSDIDLMIIGSAGFTDAVSALYSTQATLGREINPKIYRKEEWALMLDNKDAFIKEVMLKPRMDVIGEGNEFG